MALPEFDAIRIAVIGLGYVGLPVATALAAHWPVTGFDTNAVRIAELNAGHDRNGEISTTDLRHAAPLFVADPDALSANVWIITVPTPVDAQNAPDLTQLLAATALVGARIRPGDCVIYESTVYPGATEDECAPVLEAASGLILNRDFWIGYSPERINPGDPDHGLADVVKITSGSTPDAAAFVDRLYQRIVAAGTHPAPSIRVAEAAKVIENTQRDVNIALVNEMALIFNLLDIDTQEVLKAAGTKWNFLPFRPGLVGGHCIGVDPYYLTHKAQAAGYDPEVVLAGRRMNDGIGAYLARRLLQHMTRADMPIKAARILVLGLTFKENCADLRNTGVINIITELQDFGAVVDVWDPHARAEDAEVEFGITLAAPETGAYDAVIIAVAHDEFRAMDGATLRGYCRPGGLIMDVKSIRPRDEVDLVF